METIFQKQGFTIVEFNPVLNDPDVSTVIENLGLTDMVRRSNGFLYMDSNYRLVFVNEKLNEDERKIVLAHEEGHYLCGHAFTREVVGRNVAEEQEANEFSHYLLQDPVNVRASRAISRYKKPLIIGAVVAGLAGGGSAVSREYREQQLYQGEYYVTMHGEKYHKKNCVTIEGHEVRRLTKEDVESGKYEPCSVCQPDED
ncbi:MAG: ImmA/IrrE family metallo-endopeptidase [Blautia sp.]|nr:ImmA/IrrE family metallo-endopeptidase [Blautia sp.]